MTPEDKDDSYDIDITVCYNVNPNRSNNLLLGKDTSLKASSAAFKSYFSFIEKKV